MAPPADTSNLFSKSATTLGTIPVKEPSTQAPIASPDLKSSSDGTLPEPKPDVEKSVSQLFGLPDSQIGETQVGKSQNLSDRSTALDTQATTLKTTGTSLGAEKDNLSALSDKIESQRGQISPDKLDAMIKDYNAQAQDFQQKVDKYNSDIDDYTSQANTFNSDVKTFNGQKVQNLRPVNSFQSILANIDPKAQITDANTYIGDMFDDALDKITTGISSFGSENTPSKRIGAGLDAIQGIGEILFSPVSFAFHEADQVPGLNIATKGIESYSAMTSDALSQSVQYWVNQLPVSQSTKDNIAKPLGDIAGFAEQIFLGDKASETLAPIIKAKVNDIKTFLTKDIITSHTPGNVVYFDSTKVKDIWQSNTLLTDEEKSNILKTIGVDKAKLKDALKNGISVGVDARTIVTLQDKPYWAKIKSLFNIASDSKVISDTGGKPAQAPRGLLQEGVHPVLKDEIKSAIDTHGEDVTHQALQDNLSIDAPTASKIMASSIAPSTDGEIQASNAKAIAQSGLVPQSKGALKGMTINTEGAKSIDEIAASSEKYVTDNKDDLAKEYLDTHGNNFNVDKFKDLIPGHIENPTISEAFHTPAAKVLGEMIDKVISEKGDGKTLTFLAGATAAGKSSAVEGLNEGKNRLAGSFAIVDGTLASDRSVSQINKALKNGYRVEIKYIENSPKRILENLRTRASAGGRTVPIETAFNSLQKSRQNVLKIFGKNSDNPNLNIEVIDNSKAVPTIVENGVDFLKTKSYSNNDIAGFKEDAYSKLEKDYEQKNITKKQYEGFTRRKANAKGSVSPEKQFTGEESSEEREKQENSEINTEGGFIDIGAIIKDADAKIKGFIEGTMKPIAVSENLTDSFADLEGASQADLESAYKLVQKLDISPKDDEALYHHAENPDAPLTDKQKDLEAKFDIPLKELNQKLYERIKNEGQPLPESDTYISRFAKDKSSVMQKIFDPVKDRIASAKQGSVLSKSAPSLKKRTMKALTDEKGNKIVASIKKGEVTGFINKKAQSLGHLDLEKNSEILDKEVKPLKNKINKLQTELKTLTSTKSRTESSPKRIKSIHSEIIETTNKIAEIENKYDDENLNQKVFEAENGKKYTVGEATTAEIEQHTDLEYYHSALASRLLQYIKLRQIDRANQFLESWKASKDFADVAKKSDEIPPEGWKMTSQVNFRNYFFEPRTAEVLDDMQKKMESGQYNDAFQGINRVLANAIFFNGLAHPINVAVTWAYARGASSLVLPSAYKTGFASMARAWTALMTKNDDYLELLRNGAHLMSSDINNKKLAELLTKKLTDDLEKAPDLHEKIMKALGFAGKQLSFKNNVIYKLSHNMAWLSNDLLTIQSIFENMDRQGMTMKDSIKEVSRFIPDYRQQARLLDKPLSALGAVVGKEDVGGATARTIAKIVYNRNISMFGSYHVGLMQSFSNAIKDAVGPGKGFGAEDMKTRAKGFDKLAMLAILGLVIYPFIDQEIQKITGNPNTYITRSGIVKYPYLAYKWATNQTSTEQALQSVITPAVGTQTLAELFFNRDLFTGNNIYGSAGEGLGGFLANKVAPISDANKVASGSVTPGSFAATLLGIHTPKNTQVGIDLNNLIYVEKPKIQLEMKDHISAGDTAGAEQIGHDFNQQLSAQIKKADIAGGNSGDASRVAYFLNQYGVKMPGQKAMDNYAAKQGKGIIDKVLPNGKPVINQGTPLPATGVIGTIVTYAKAIGVDPLTAFHDIFTGQAIRMVNNKTIIVNRMALSASQADRNTDATAQGLASPKGMNLDHIVPLEGGGDNSESNLQLIPEAQWKANTPVENFLNQELTAQRLTGAQVRELAIRFKAGNGEILSPELMKEYQDKYNSQPLTVAQVKDYKDNLIDK